MKLFRKKSKPPIRSPRSVEHDESLTFRRSRTLTGSSSEQVRTASETLAQIRSPRLKEHELRAHQRRLGSYLLIVLVVAGGLLMLLSQYAGINDVRVTSSTPLARTPEKAFYGKLINEYFATHPMERFRFARDHDALMRFMNQKAPEVSSVEFEHVGLAQAHVEVRFRVPVVVWKLSGGLSYVDGDGRVFGKNYYNEPSITVRDDSGIEATNGAIISDRFLYYIGRVIALTNVSGTATITGATIPRNTTREIDFNLEGRGYVVKTQLGRDPASQAADIVNATRYLDEKGLTPSYVDVRVAGKAAYR